MSIVLRILFLCITLGFGNVEALVFPISIPKCGTHLTNKCLDLLGLKKLFIPHNNSTLCTPKARIAHFRATEKQDFRIRYVSNSNFPKKLFPISHIMYDDEIGKLVREFNVIFTIRDPRDRLISGAYWIKKRPKDFPVTSKLKIDQIIMGLINQDYLLEKQNGQDDQASQYSVNNYKHWLGWLHADNVCVIKFENLVGEKGGGDNKLAHQEILKIVHHCGLDESKVNLNYVIKNLFGKSSTFRSGQIGNWKTHFTKEHKEAFKQNVEACKIVIDLGYEQDNSWLD